MAGTALLRHNLCMFASPHPLMPDHSVHPDYTVLPHRARRPLRPSDYMASHMDFPPQYRQCEVRDMLLCIQAQLAAGTQARARPGRGAPKLRIWRGRRSQQARAGRGRAACPKPGARGLAAPQPQFATVKAGRARRTSALCSTVKISSNVRGPPSGAGAQARCVRASSSFRPACAPQPGALHALPPATPARPSLPAGAESAPHAVRCRFWPHTEHGCAQKMRAPSTQTQDGAVTNTVTQHHHYKNGYGR